MALQLWARGKHRMSESNPETRHKGIPCLSSKGDRCRLEVILEGRFDDIREVDCREYNILIEMGWRRHRRRRRSELRGESVYLEPLVGCVLTFSLLFSELR
jgi:hypothetical protein